MRRFLPFFFFITTTSIFAQNFNPDALRNVRDFNTVAKYQYNQKQYQKALNSVERSLKIKPSDSAYLYGYKSSLAFDRKETAFFYAGKMSKAAKEKEHLSAFGLAQMETEWSPQIMSVSSRGNAVYRRIGATARLGWRIMNEQSLSYSRQIIAEPLLTGMVHTPEKIHINQTAYYNKVSFVLSPKLLLKLAYQYQQTKMSNLRFDNNVAMIAMKYYGKNYELQGDVMLNRIMDSSFNQYNMQLTVYPKGNRNFYVVSRASLQKGKSYNNYVFTETVGAKVSNRLLAEIFFTGNTAVNYVAHDAVFMNTSIDATNYKGGINFILDYSKARFQFGSAYEKRTLFGTDRHYNIIALTGLVTYKL